MALDKLVDSTQLDSDLASVANAIREKGGTSAQLAFPAGFVSAIDAIPTGGDTYPYNVSVGTIVLASDGPIVIPTPSIDSTQFVSVFFMARNYEQLAQDLFAAGKKLSFGLRWSIFDEYKQKSGLGNTGEQKLRYGVDNTALNYYSRAAYSFGSDAITFTDVYAAATYDYVAIYKEAQA
jgi:hypothetical protein